MSIDATVVDRLRKDYKDLVQETVELSKLINHKDKRIQELLDSNNELLERARKAEHELYRVLNIS